LRYLGWLTLMLASGAPLAAQGRIVEDSVRSPALEHNLLGDATVRRIRVYLPPSYDRETTRRYPAVYLLHSLDGSVDDWSAGSRSRYPGFDLARAMDSLIAAGTIREFLVVMPDGHNRLGGSIFTNSSTTGEWETYLLRDVIRQVDQHYRTMRRGTSRGVAGHSMGAGAALRLAMRFPGIFSAAYALAPNAELPCRVLPAPAADALLNLRSLAELDSLDGPPRICAAYAAAWSPDSARGPVYADLPFSRIGAAVAPDSAVLDRWQLLEMAPRYRDGLVRLRGLAFDVGAADPVRPGVARLDSLLTRLRVRHQFETYPGDHWSGVAARLIGRVLPFFSTTLDFGPAEP
jgi:enterochelin esterase-like enzyme